MYMETGTDHTTLIHSQLWGRGDSTLGYIHMSIGVYHTTPIHSDLLLISCMLTCIHIHVET